jgi:DNA-binding LacI/PurR family transcriptional regulator
LTPEFNLEIPTGDSNAAYKAARKMLAHPQRPTAIFALWQNFQIAVAKAAAELGLVLGKDLEMVGWSSAESYESQYVSQFVGTVPPAVTWSVATMVETAMARLEERRNNPQLPVIHLRIPTQLRLHSGK